MLGLLLVSVLAGATCQATEATQAHVAPAQTPAPVEVAPDLVVPAQPEPDDPVVCEMHATVGSILRQRVCRRQSDIARQEEDTRQRLHNMRRWGPIRERTPM